jgi:hypothetical protein
VAQVTGLSYDWEDAARTPPSRVPYSEQSTFLHGFNTTWAWLEAAGPQGRANYIGRKLSQILLEGSTTLPYYLGQLQAIHEWVDRREGPASEAP